jgi:hypothetical protein
MNSNDHFQLDHHVLKLHGDYKVPLYLLCMVMINSTQSILFNFINFISIHQLIF